MDKIRAYKLTRPDGFDFYTGKTINYGANIGGVVAPPNPDAKSRLCSSGIIHASINPNDCFIGANIPCRAFLVEGVPVAGDKQKHGFTELSILEEIIDLDKLFGWKYSEASNPINPLLIPAHKVTKKDIESLKRWDSVRASIWDSVRASVGASVGATVGYSVWDSVWASVRASVGASVGATVGAYTGSLFPNITDWKYASKGINGYPYQPVVDLWKRGFIGSFDGKIWRLHSGKDAKIVWEGDLN